MIEMIDIIKGYATRLALGALNLIRFAAEKDVKRIRQELADLQIEIEDAVKYAEAIDDGHES